MYTLKPNRSKPLKMPPNKGGKGKKIAINAYIPESMKIFDRKVKHFSPGHAFHYMMKYIQRYMY